MKCSPSATSQIATCNGVFKISALSRFFSFYHNPWLLFTTRTHDSLKISNGKWNWWSHGIGWRSALDYLIKVRGMTLPEAVLQIDGQVAIAPPIPSKVREPAAPRRLLLPEKNKSNDHVVAYLTGRGMYA